MITIPGHTYTINVLTAPVSIIAVAKDGTQETIATAEEAGQYEFRAQTITTVFSPEANVGLRTRNVENFNGAPATGSGGGGSSRADQDYDPTSTHAQSGIAVSQAIQQATGLSEDIAVAADAAVTAFEGAVESQVRASEFAQKARDAFRRGQPIRQAEGTTPEIQIENYVWYNLNPDTTSCTIVPVAYETTSENYASVMTLAITPSATLEKGWLKAPEGSTLTWPWNSEPEWDQADSYIIEVAQTGPTTLAARPFNAPQGAKLPDTGHYVIWDENNVAVAARFDGQTEGHFQFNSNPDSIPNIAAALAVATFDKQTHSRQQFYQCNADLYLPLATFERATDVWGIFGGNKSVYAPRAIFNYAYAGDLGRAVFDYVNYAIAPSARFGKCVTVNYMNRSLNKDRYFDFASMTFEALTGADWVFDIAAKTGKMYSLNLRSLNSATAMWSRSIDPEDFTDYIKETLMAIAWGPRLQVDATGNFILGEDGKEIPAPVTRINPTTGDPEGLDLEDLTGRRKTAEDVGESPTGWGLKDFRKVGPDGTFEKNEEGEYVYVSTGHSFRLPIKPSGLPASLGGTAAYGEEAAAALEEIVKRGWNLN